MVKCKQCENEFDEKYGVCPMCGWVYEAEAMPPASFPAYSAEKPAAKKSSKAKLFVIVGVIAAVLIVGVIVGVLLLTSNTGKPSEWVEQISLGEKYLSEENYDEAIAAFKKAIDIAPNNPEAYLKLADAYLAKGDTQNAVQTLETGLEKTGSEEIRKKLDALKNGGTAEENSQGIYKEPEYTLGTIIASGECGKDGSNLTWELDENGLLVISGEGEMKEYGLQYDVMGMASPDSPWFETEESIKTVIVKKGVTSIGSYAFWNCKSLTNVTVSDSVTSIESDAFIYCANLTSINIPDGVTIIGDRAFSTCTSLKSITIPDSMTSIGEWAFCSCDSVTNINIPDSVASIGSFAFRCCQNLTSINVSSNNSKYTSIDGVLLSKDKKTLLWCPDGKRGSYSIPDGVTEICECAFETCTSLTSITIPDSVTKIGYFAFDNCTSLTGINIPDSVTSIERNVFNRCSSLKSITIPDSVTKIGDYVFNGCTSLKNITIPDSVTRIGGSVFEGCTSLESITIPDSVTSIGGSTFSEWGSSQTIYIKGRSEAPSGWSWDWDYGCDARIVWNA